ncbi:MAG: hypothetical protein JWO35_181, partial [Candidatus Saccharibacteria bacterium]|nr:hypothetical protein [Candidatus Saccharibacteria bacterium]
LTQLLKHVQTVPVDDSRLLKIHRKVTDGYRYFWHHRGSNRLVGAVFLLQSIVFMIAVLGTMFNSVDSFQALFRGSDSYDNRLIIGQLVSSFVAAAFVIYGAIKLRSSRADALEWFRRAVLINLFLAEFFIFSRIEFGAIPGFLVNLLLLLVLHFALDQERQARVRKV